MGRTKSNFVDKYEFNEIVAYINAVTSEVKKLKLPYTTCVDTKNIETGLASTICDIATYDRGVVCVATINTASGIDMTNRRKELDKLFKEILPAHVFVDVGGITYSKKFAVHIHFDYKLKVSN